MLFVCSYQLNEIGDVDNFSSFYFWFFCFHASKVNGSLQHKYSFYLLYFLFFIRNSIQNRTSMHLKKKFHHHTHPINFINHYYIDGSFVSFILWANNFMDENLIRYYSMVNDSVLEAMDTILFVHECNWRKATKKEWENKKWSD